MKTTAEVMVTGGGIIGFAHNYSELILYLGRCTRNQRPLLRHHSGHRLKLSPIIGVTVAKLIMEGKASTVDIAPLRVTRFHNGNLLESSYRHRVLT